MSRLLSSLIQGCRWNPASLEAKAHLSRIMNCHGCPLTPAEMSLILLDSRLTQMYRNSECPLLAPGLLLNNNRHAQDMRAWELLTGRRLWRVSPCRDLSILTLSVSVYGVRVSCYLSRGDNSR